MFVIAGTATAQDSIAVEPGKPVPAGIGKPAEISMTRAGSTTTDLRTLPQTKPVKFERPEREEPEITRVELPGGQEKRLRLRVLERVPWYSACETRPVKVVLVNDPSGAWPDTALVCTEPSMAAADIVAGYARRWSIEVAFRDCKQHLGLQEPQVRCARSVERAHAMAFFAYGLTVLWHALHGEGAEAPRRDRPWYKQAVRPAFPQMLGTLRLALWRGRYFGGSGDGEAVRPTKEMLDSLMHCLATVR